MKAGAVMADGPYRYVRNPLYLGVWFMVAAMAFLMPPTGALFAMTLLTVFLLRLILGEEAFLSAQLGEPYQAYLRAVPRLIPRLRTTCAACSAASLTGSALCWPKITPIGVFLIAGVSLVELQQLAHDHGHPHQLWTLARGARASCPACSPAAPASAGISLLASPGLLRCVHLKPSAILEPVAQQPVHADVIRPDQRERQQPMRVQQKRRQPPAPPAPHRRGPRCKSARPSTSPPR